MNGREAVKALLDGKRITTRQHKGCFLRLDDDFGVVNHNGDIWGSIESVAKSDCDEWFIVCEPTLTDIELVATLNVWAKDARHSAGVSVEANMHFQAGKAEAYQEAARLVEKRRLV